MRYYVDRLLTALTSDALVWAVTLTASITFVVAGVYRIR